MGALVSQPFPLRVVSCRVAGLARIWPGASLGLPDHTVLQRDSIYRVQQGEGIHVGADAGCHAVRNHETVFSSFQWVATAWKLRVCMES